MPVEIAHTLRQARLGHLLLEALPGAALRIGREDGRSAVVARMGDPRSEVLPCQHRAALQRAMGSGLARAYAGALGLTSGGELTVELLPPAGTDLGSGVFALDDDGRERLLCAVTTLCPQHAAAAIRAARTVPLPARLAGVEGAGGGIGVPLLAGLRREVHHDAMLGVTVVRWAHRAHPTVSNQIEDLARAETAALVVEEVLQSL